MVSGSKDKTLKVWGKNMESGLWEMVIEYQDTRVEDNSNCVSCVAVVKNQQGDDMVVSGSEDGTVKFWDLDNHTNAPIGVLQSSSTTERVQYVLPLYMTNKYMPEGLHIERQIQKPDPKATTGSFQPSAAIIVATGTQFW